MPVKKDKRELDLDEFEAQAIEALGQKPYFKLKIANGDPVKISHPMLLTDERQAAVDRVRAREDLDKNDEGEPTNYIDGKPAAPFNSRFARAVLGDDEHDRFLAGGGKSNHIVLAWDRLTEVAKVEEDADDPK